MKKAEKQLHPHNYILSLNKRWLLPLMCSNPAKATYDEWIEKFHTGSDEIGYFGSSLGINYQSLGYYHYLLPLRLPLGFCYIV